MDVDILPRRIYAIVRLLHGPEEDEVVAVKSVPYQSVSLELICTHHSYSYSFCLVFVNQTFVSGAPMHPRLQMILGGRLIAVQFGDAVTLCARGDYIL